MYINFLCLFKDMLTVRYYGGFMVKRLILINVLFIALSLTLRTGSTNHWYTWFAQCYDYH